MKNTRLFVAVLLAVTSLSVSSFAQEGASSASVSRTRAIAKSNQSYSVKFQGPDEVRVEEFVNYHRHRIPLPKNGKSVEVDLRTGNQLIDRRKRNAVVQVGMATAFAYDRTDLRPLNLSIVIDKSGSMRSSDKLTRVRQSLRKFVDQLRPEDLLSIVVFDSSAEVIRSTAQVGNRLELKEVISGINASGSTNLHGGLMLGYQQVQQNYVEGATNRVILLTDGIANVGVKDPAGIAAASLKYNSEGIDLSTIGSGLESGS